MTLSRPLLLALPLLGALVFAGQALGEDYGPPPTKATVKSVYDGDTFTLATGDKVRVSAVNTPELKPAEAYGVEARNAAESFLAGKEVTLSYGASSRDGYGRLVAWVEVDGRSLEEELVEKGFAHTFLIPPVDVGDPDALLAAQKRAKAAGRGIWSLDTYQGSLHMTSFHANAPGDDRENVNGEYIRACNITEQPLNVDGYRIADLSGNSYTFPALIIPPGHTVKIKSGHGDHQTNPAEQLEIYLGSDQPIWNNKQDRATIYDKFGKVVDVRHHEVKKASN
ncbi:MAG: thermonuclease family protein [Myxococcota bacterium]|nr:thermonuclease family protein [Myxococcota bacterium]